MGNQEMTLQSELAALESEIARVREKIAAEHGLRLESKDAVREVIGQKVYSGERAPKAPPVATPPTSTPVQASTSTTTKTASYLDLLSPEEIERVNELIQSVSKDGISKTIERAKNEPAFILDAFHDALVDKLYDELVQNGMLKS